MTCYEAGRLLDAYMDDELGSTDRAAVAEHLAGCAECARQLEDRDALVRLVRQAPYYTAPPRLHRAIAAMPAPSRFPVRRLAWAAVLVAAISLGTVVGTREVASRRAASLTAQLPDRIVESHARALMTDHLVDVRSSDQHTVKPWFPTKVDFSPPVQDLAAEGFPLVGGRVDEIAGTRVAALVYERRRHVITLFAWPASGGPGPESRTIRGFHLRHWTAGGMTLWVVSDLNEAELDQFTTALGR